MKKSFLYIGIAFFTMVSCNIEEIGKYNEDFIGKWRTAVFYSLSKGDSARNFMTIDGDNSGFGMACDVEGTFKNCLNFQSGTVKYNKASKGLQVGNSVDQIHYVDVEPFVNSNGKWEVIIDSISYFKY